jgi:hypothetical protein
MPSVFHACLLGSLALSATFALGHETRAAVPSFRAESTSTRASVIRGYRTLASYSGAELLDLIRARAPTVWLWTGTAKQPRADSPPRRVVGSPRTGSQWGGGAWVTTAQIRRSTRVTEVWYLAWVDRDLDRAVVASELEVWRAGEWANVLWDVNKLEWADRDGDLRIDPLEVVRHMTPLIVPLGEEVRLAALTSPKTVAFDLADAGQARSWSWITPQAGFLVWDPRGTGQVRSGRDLFGAVTRFADGGRSSWEHGYQPLATRDADGDGWLRGAELDGIAIWQDRDQDGVSDPGEVSPAVKHGLHALAVRPASREGDVWVAPSGARFAGGAVRPTYDCVLQSRGGSR